ncbi:MAG: citramalate synthase [Alphaproteobacteria bacterium]|jgi:2-isopropylmalate synthase
MRRIYLYDTTLRDGAQTKGIDFSLTDKLSIIKKLDGFGIDYIEAGFPTANETDDALFANLPKTKKSNIVAFGMTHRADVKVDKDERLNKLAKLKAKKVCIFGKSWDFHLKEDLKISPQKNLEIIENSVLYLVQHKKEVIFDAEHFFDGYKSNPSYALQVIELAFKAGARWISLCDTNGGTLPNEIFEIVSKVSRVIDGENLAIHCHNDTENAVANSLSAIQAGACQVQGTINGYGERCGNANLISIIPSLKYKMKLDVGIKNLEDLSEISQWFETKLNQAHINNRPYVGKDAFAHKGGVHGSAVKKNPKLYEHIEPELIGNEREVVISNQAGKASFIERLKGVGLKIDFDAKENKAKLEELVRLVKNLDQKGYAYDNANASFAILAKKHFDQLKTFFELKNFRVIVEKRVNANGELVTFSEAKIKLKVGKEVILDMAEGIGPVDSIYKVLSKTLVNKYKILNNISLIDYKVRIITPEKATEAITRVEIVFLNNKTNKNFTTIGVSENIIDASYNAIADAFNFVLG